MMTSKHTRSNPRRPMRKGDAVIRVRDRRTWRSRYGAVGTIIEIDTDGPRAALVEWHGGSSYEYQQLCLTSDLRRISRD